MPRSLDEKLGGEARLNRAVFTKDIRADVETYQRNGTHPKDDPTFQQQAVDAGNHKYHIFLTAKCFKLEIWNVPIRDLAYGNRDISLTSSPLLTLPRQVVSEFLRNAPIRRYEVKLKGQSYIIDAVDRGINNNEAQEVSMCWYVGPSSLTETKLTTLIAFLAANNDLSNGRDYFQFFKCFVDVYYELVNQGGAMNTERAARENLSTTFDNWLEISRDRPLEFRVREEPVGEVFCQLL